MNKYDLNPHFELWLARYGKRLIEVANTCASAEENKTPKSQSSGQSDSAQQAAPKQD